MGLGLQDTGYTCDGDWPRYSPCRDFSGPAMRVFLFDDGEVLIYESPYETYLANDVQVADLDVVFEALGLDNVEGGEMRTAVLTRVSVSESYIGMLEHYEVTMGIDDTEQYPLLVIQMIRSGW